MLTYLLTDLLTCFRYDLYLLTYLLTYLLICFRYDLVTYLLTYFRYDRGDERAPREYPNQPETLMRAVSK